MSTRSEPLSIESLLQKQKQEKDAASKPKFLSKEERAKLAIANRAKEISEQRAKDEQSRKNREALEREAEMLAVRENSRSDRYTGYTESGRNGNNRQQDNSGGRYGHSERNGSRGGGRDKRSYRDRDAAPATPPVVHGSNVPTGPRAERAKNSMPPPPVPTSSVSNITAGESSQSSFEASSEAYTPVISTDELSAIRSRYLGADKKKRKIRKMNDRKFVFDWDAQDDTGADDAMNLRNAASAGGSGAHPQQQPQSMFGRGKLAGVDDGSDPMERRKASKTGLDERHWSEKTLDEMKERDWRIFREDFSIAARGGGIPHPLRSWAESAIPPSVLQCIDDIGYKEPSPIQRQAIPIGLQNRDIIGIAETGSGKTAAFVIPMLSFISTLPAFNDENRHLGPYALILAPTRELAQQIESESKKFATPLGFTCVSIVGGRAVEEQQFNLREGAHIVIATPGRLKDVLERHVLVLGQCRYVVMDEADRMVHLGFEADLNFILDRLPEDVLEGEDKSMQMDVDEEGVETFRRKGRNRVTTLFSATMPAAVERLARKYLRKPAIITIGEAGRAVDTVEQRVEFVSGDEKKKQKLLEILNSGQYASPIIVFVNQKKTADMVAKDLQRANWSTSTLHSGKNQEQREAALQALRDGHADVLVATDLAGRGIDVQDVSLVINYQMAGTIEAYVHRIGRTGRAGKLGTAITFLTNDDEEVMYELRQEISKSPVSKVPPELAKHEASQHKVTREMIKRKREDDG